jgi:UDP-GlcNAc:undecaprenyl-phosphate/decaprenyl-phosphate GlcNAc-1-phosphate transferase
MNTAIQLLALGTLSLVLILVNIPWLRNLALRFNLVDKPNYRKVHSTPVPLIGGISIALISILVLLVSGHTISLLRQFLPILSSGFILLIVGTIDYKNDLSAKFKLAIQLLLSLMVALSGIRITSLYGVLGINEIATWAQYLLTVIVVTGVVNAFNLMDGVDGLVGGLSLIGFLMFLFASILFKDYNLSRLSIVFIGATLGFLKFNLTQTKKIFMGDSGSLFLGFVLVTTGIQFMEKQIGRLGPQHTFGFALVLLFFSIPVLDSIRVYIGRMKIGKSPFRPDKSHLHHLLLNAGLSHKKISIFIVLFCLLLFFVGFGLRIFFPITAIIISIVVLFTAVVKILKLINQLNYWILRIRRLEVQKT